VVLLAVLAGVAAYGVPRIARELTGTGPAATCVLAPAPSLVKWSLAQVDEAVRASGLKSLIGDGTTDLEGLQDPSCAWADGYPTGEHSPDPNITPADAGYEVRWWSEGNRDHQAADI